MRARQMHIWLSGHPLLIAQVRDLRLAQVRDLRLALIMSSLTISILLLSFTTGIITNKSDHRNGDRFNKSVPISTITSLAPSSCALAASAPAAHDSAVNFSASAATRNSDANSSAFSAARDSATSSDHRNGDRFNKSVPISEDSATSSAAASPAAAVFPAPDSPDLAFQVVEDSSDTWFWNAETINRHHKADGTWTYYRAPLIYSYLEVKWDAKSRTAAYFLDGNRILAQEAQRFAKAGSGFAVGSKTPVGDPRFTLSASHSPPAGREKNAAPPYAAGDKGTGGPGDVSLPTGQAGLSPRLLVSLSPCPPCPPPRPSPWRLKDQYQQKYYPDLWQFTTLAVTRDYVWVAIRSIPQPPEPIPGFRKPDGSWSQRHFRESPAWPIQGGILRINKNTGEWVRFTEKNGLPDGLVCRPLRGESPYLPHFLASWGQGQSQGQNQSQGQSQSQDQDRGHDRGQGFAQEVVAITPLAKEVISYQLSVFRLITDNFLLITFFADGDTGRVRVRFTTSSDQQVWYDEKLERWENAR